MISYLLFCRKGSKFTTNNQIIYEKNNYFSINFLKKTFIIHFLVSHTHFARYYSFLTYDHNLSANQLRYCILVRLGFDGTEIGILMDQERPALPFTKVLVLGILGVSH